MARRSRVPERRDDADAYGMDEVDAFAARKEKVLLEGSALAQDGDSDGFEVDEDEEEVLGMSEHSSDDYEEEEEEEEEEERLDGKQAFKKVFGRNLDTGGDADVGDEDEESRMLDHENAWGSSKKEYYGADDLDDEDAAKEIEAEALRQQQKHLEELNMEDYYDANMEAEWSKNAKEFDTKEFKQATKQADTTVSIKDILNMDVEAKKNFMKTMFPEFLPLCKEFNQLSAVLHDLNSQEQDNEFIKLKTIALSSYLGTISSYFGILLHELNNNDDFSSMKDHPVMEAILMSKEVWRQADELPNTSIENGMRQEGEEEEGDDDDNDEFIEGDQVEEFDEDALESLKESASNTEVTTTSNKESEDEHSSSEDDVDIEDFEEYVAQPRVTSKKAHNTDEENEIDDFVETGMADVDAQEKKARRKTLRFYTSKIDQQDNKKIDRFKGDDDIPYKERLFERQQRLLEEARKRGMHDKNGSELDDKDYNSSDEAISKSINKQSEEDYYSQIQQKRALKKEARMQAHKTAKRAAREGKLAELVENMDEGGKRAINYQILKNKGLTPHRKKDNRNSRVKKRKQYEKAQKKLKSVRAVYSGGQSGAYEGEKTGIKKNLTKSVKFKS